MDIGCEEAKVSPVPKEVELQGPSLHRYLYDAGAIVIKTLRMPATSLEGTQTQRLNPTVSLKQDPGIIIKRLNPIYHRRPLGEYRAASSGSDNVYKLLLVHEGPPNRDCVRVIPIPRQDDDVQVHLALSIIEQQGGRREVTGRHRRRWSRHRRRDQNGVSPKPDAG